MARRILIEIGFYGLAILLAVFVGALYQLLFGNAVQDIPLHDSYLVLNVPLTMAILFVPVAAWLIFGLRVIVQKFMRRSTWILFLVNTPFASIAAPLFILVLLNSFSTGGLPRRYYTFTEFESESYQFYVAPSVDLRLLYFLFGFILLSGIIFLVIGIRKRKSLPNL